jgi:hydrogenase maturation protease
MNSHKKRYGIIAVGSFYGDDQFGWLVADELRCVEDVEIKKTSQPIDLMDFVQENDAVILVDAASGLPDGESFRRIEYGNENERKWILNTRSFGTHDIGLVTMLQLAELLGYRIDHLTIWVGNALFFKSFSLSSSCVAVAAKQCAAEIAREVHRARTHSCAKPSSTGRKNFR